MVRFILQEGEEKASDIDAKAEEEYNIHKGELIQRARLKLNEEYDFREKRMKVKMLIQNSVLLNANRMKEIEAKQEIIDDISALARERIIRDLGCTARYANLMVLLIIEGLFKLMEGPVFIRCRKQDLEIVEKVIPHCEEAYATSTSRKMKLKVDKKIHLPEKFLGGVELSVKNHKIMIKNTIDSRVEQTIQNCTPPISRCLFGTESRQMKF